MTQNQTEEKIRHYLKNIETNSLESPDQIDKVLHDLASYECWQPFLSLMTQALQRMSDSPKKLEYYLWLAYVQHANIEDTKASAKICAKMVSTFNLNYTIFRRDYLYHIISPEDWEGEAEILESLASTFKNKQDQIRCLERLCLIYEKKIPRENKLAEAYERLLEADGLNIKALKYFKVLFAQQREWDSVAGILYKLLNVVKGNDIYRVALELGAILIYHLNKPKNAIEILEKYGKNSPLDMGTLLYDAYYRLGNWNSCLNILEITLAKTSEIREKAVIYYKMALMSLKKNEINKAAAFCDASLLLDKDLLESYEMLITLSIQLKQWDRLLVNLKRLRDKVKNYLHKEKLGAVIEYLESGLAHV